MKTQEFLVFPLMLGIGERRILDNGLPGAGREHAAAPAKARCPLLVSPSSLHLSAHLEEWLPGIVRLEKYSSIDTNQRGQRE